MGSQPCSNFPPSFLSSLQYMLPLLRPLIRPARQLTITRSFAATAHTRAKMSSPYTVVSTESTLSDF
jgi:hypothetical protein